MPEEAAMLREALPTAVAEVVLPTCARSPVQRYGSAAAMGAALRGAADAMGDGVDSGSGGSVPPQTPPAAGWRPCSRRGSRRGA